MVLLNRSRALTVRKAATRDVRAIKQLMTHNWAVYTRLMPPEIESRLENCVALLAEDDTALRAFALVEPQPPDSGLVLTLAVHDNSVITHALDALIPALEQELRAHQLNFIMQIGPAQWLTGLLPQYGFFSDSQIVTFEWQLQPLPPITPHPKLKIVSAHLAHLPKLLALDRMAFGPTWRKPRHSFREALGHAVSFNVGTIDGEIIAYEWCDQFGEHGHLTRLATHPRYQRQGIGAQMLHQAMQTLIERGVQTITLNTQTDNLPSQRLYRRFGFTETTQVVDVLVKML